jgi:hypothetical protein
MAGDMEILKIERIAMGLFDGVARKITFPDLVFEDEDQAADGDDCIGTAAHARDAELQKEVRVWQGGGERLQLRDLDLPGGFLGRFIRKR